MHENWLKECQEKEKEKLLQEKLIKKQQQEQKEYQQKAKERKVAREKKQKEESISKKHLQNQLSMWQMRFNEDLPRSNMWQLNPYPLCPRCSKGADFCIESCTRDCLLLKDGPFTASMKDTKNNTIPTIPCNIQKQYREAYKNRMALTKLIDIQNRTIFLPCSFCGKEPDTVETSRCGGCKMMLFCSAECKNKKP